ncbi:MAG: hypothetical protein RIC87_01320 [Kiloniellales bacterium]
MARVFLIPKIWPLDGGFQSFAMLFPMNFGELPGADFMPYLGIGISYALAPAYSILGANFFAAIASAELMTLGILAAAIATLCILFGLGKQSVTLLVGMLVLWAVLLCEMIYGEPGIEFISAGNSLLFLRQGLPFLVFLLLVAWALRARRLRARRSDDECTASPALRFPIYPAAILAGLVPFWSNASGAATSIALLIVVTLASCLSQPTAWRRGKTLALSFALFAACLAATLFLVTDGQPEFYIQNKLAGVADYQFWYFAPFDAYHRVFTLSDLLRASVWRFGWPSLLGHVGILLGLTLLWRRFGLSDLRTLGLILVLLAQFGTGMIAQLGGHLSARYLLVFYSFGLLVGVIALAQITLPRLIERTRWSLEACFAVGRLLSLVGLCLLVGAVVVEIHNDRQAVARVFYPPLGLYVDETHAAELDAFAALRDHPAIRERAAQDRIFSAYLSPSEIGLDAMPATRFGANIHVLGDAARAEYMQRLSATEFPLVAQIAQGRTEENWHHWQLRANWYLYAYMLEHYEPAFRTRYMAYYRPREVAPTIPADLPHLSCEITRQDAHVSELLIVDDSQPGSAHYGSNWVLNAAVDYKASLTPRSFPMNLLPFVGTRGMIIVNDRSSGFMESIVPVYKAPFYLYKEEHGMLYGLPFGDQKQDMAIEHRFGSPSRVALKAEPAARSNLLVEACRVRPVVANPYVAFEANFPLTTEIDPRELM